MSIVTYAATIKGISSLLQHAFEQTFGQDEEAREIARENNVPREEARKFLYLSNDGGVFIPGAAFGRLLREAGSSHKQKGSRKSVKWIVPAGCTVTDDQVTLLNGDGSPMGAEAFEVDSRPVVIPSTKGRIMRHRPRFDEWSAKISMEIDEKVISAKLIHQLLEEGGRRLGILDFRPERGGPFGRFEVVEWSPVD